MSQFILWTGFWPFLLTFNIA